MPQHESRLTVHNEGGIVCIRFKDHNILDEASIGQIAEEISKLIEQSANPRILVNFEQVQHLSSSALGALITINNKVKQKGGQLRLSNIDEQIYEVFLITRLHKLFKIYENAKEARESFT